GNLPAAKVTFPSLSHDPKRMLLYAKDRITPIATAIRNRPQRTHEERASPGPCHAVRTHAITLCVARFVVKTTRETIGFDFVPGGKFSELSSNSQSRVESARAGIISRKYS